MPSKLIIWTLISNMFILIGAGHGVGPIVLVEGFALVNPSAFADRISFSLHNSYDDLILIAMLFAIIGQITLIITLAFRNPKQRFYILIIASCFYI